MSESGYTVPDFVLAAWWIFVTVALSAATIAIIITILNYLLEQYQNRKEAYLRAKKLKLDMKRIYGVGDNGNQS